MAAIAADLPCSPRFRATPGEFSSIRVSILGLYLSRSAVSLSTRLRIVHRPGRETRSLHGDDLRRCHQEGVSRPTLLLTCRRQAVAREDSGIGSIASAPTWKIVELHALSVDTALVPIQVFKPVRTWLNLCTCSSHRTWLSYSVPYCLRPLKTYSLWQQSTRPRSTNPR